MSRQRPTSPPWIGITPLLAILAVLSTGCGGGSDNTSPTSSAAKAPPTTTASSTKAAEPAEDYLKKINDELDTVLADYRAGNKGKALELAKSIGEGYEGVPEQTVAKAAPAVNRQLDPLIEATIPGAIKRGVSAQDLATQVQRAQGLITKALEEIEKGED